VVNSLQWRKQKGVIIEKSKRNHPKRNHPKRNHPN
jgi:hypothetical protein